jgi:hypothetical protein
MLATGIKNCVLFILIILILHFLIKNSLLDKNREHLVSTTQQAAKEDTIEQHESKDNDKDNDKELFKYVMEETEPSKFFEPQANDNFETASPVACDAKVIMNTSTFEETKKKSHSPKNQQNNFLTIHEYEKESGLNGGNLFDGLSGYDENYSNYEAYHCGK